MEVLWKGVALSKRGGQIVATPFWHVSVKWQFYWVVLKYPFEKLNESRGWHCERATSWASAKQWLQGKKQLEHSDRELLKHHYARLIDGNWEEMKMALSKHGSIHIDRRWKWLYPNMVLFILIGDGNGSIQTWFYPYL
ncbi:hypothetical protein CDAR_7821 [Caerostris darwini]|uniref:Uncharacterized protein n=1 Tax=Caerostris darwini TaxID=1538125 RepID=A0AAV4Q9Q1_9ARAC|nr:hypothetical protein CDAR_7821 [Caerostris darwini]